VRSASWDSSDSLWPANRRSLRGRAVAIDQRGYNLSDTPKGVDSYDMRLLVADVASVVKSVGRDKATVVGHDWGGIVAWNVAMTLPQMTETLIILNLRHPNGLARELRNNHDQINNREYARNFQTKSSSDRLCSSAAR
jgi:epoxide hydrolase 4